MTTDAQAYPNDPASVRSARAHVRELLAALDPAILDRALLIVSELATNAVTHAHSSFTLSVDVSDSGVRLELHDGGPGRPRARHPSPEEPHGRGLLIVDGIADRWGVTVHADGSKTIWVELAAHEDHLETPTR